MRRWPYSSKHNGAVQVMTVDRNAPLTRSIDSTWTKHLSSFGSTKDNNTRHPSMVISRRNLKLVRSNSNCSLSAATTASRWCSISLSLKSQAWVWVFERQVGKVGSVWMRNLLIIMKEIEFTSSQWQSDFHQIVCSTDVKFTRSSIWSEMWQVFYSVYTFSEVHLCFSIRS